MNTKLVVKLFLKNKCVEMWRGWIKEMLKVSSIIVLTFFSMFIVGAIIVKLFPNYYLHVLNKSSTIYILDYLLVGTVHTVFLFFAIVIGYGLFYAIPINFSRWVKSNWQLAKNQANEIEKYGNEKHPLKVDGFTITSEREIDKDVLHGKHVYGQD